jgi:amino acid adenylation domain-containing protein
VSAVVTPAGDLAGPPADAADPTRMTRLLLDSFARTPDAPAVSDETEQITYAELRTRALELAEVLRAHGAGPDTVVAISAERSVGLAVAVVGVLLADAAYLPLDPSWPTARLERILGEAKPVVLLADGLGAEALRGLGGQLLGLDGSQPSAGTAPSPGAEPRAVAGADDLAYVIYTSGSTGWPKGVAVPHRGLVNRLRWMQERFVIGPGDAVLQKTPYTFDVSVWEFLWPLITGARLVMARPEGHRDPEYLAEVIRAQRITVAHFVPSMLALFLSSVEPGSCPSLRHVIASGEALGTATANRFTEAHAAELHNLYGPTEASIDVTAWTCRRPEPGPSVPIGLPIRGVLTAVRDPLGRPVPAGEIGELLLGGVCLARGYLARADLTEQAFIRDPLAPDVRLYRTGDLVRRGPDGALYYHGRIDHQVKINGMRVELGEIEALAEAFAEVEHAVAVLREDTPGQRRLVLYVTPELGPETVARLRAHLAERLPSAFLPAAIAPLAALPLTSNGKCDRAALPAPSRAGSGRGASRRRPGKVG